MSNLQQNEIENEIDQIRKINQLQDKLKKKRNQFQNGLKQIEKIPIKNRQNRLKWIVKMQNFSQTKKIQNILKSILQNKIEQIAEMRRIENYEKMSKEG